MEDIPATVRLIEKSIRQEGPSALVCQLVSEALLGHLLGRGYTSVTVECKGRNPGFVEICAAGEPNSFDMPDDADESARIEAEINRNLLS